MITSRWPFIILMATLVTLAATGNLFSPSPAVIAAQVAAFGLAAWARRSFKAGTFRIAAAPASSSIIREGPYRFVRHPMYTAMVLFIAASALGRPSIWTGLTLAGASAVFVVRIVKEERLLRVRFPDYADYARSTKAVIPFIL